MPDDPIKSARRVLEPNERIAEVLFGLIMVLTFTGSLSVAEADRAEVRTMLIGALGCNLAWGIIDARAVSDGQPVREGHGSCLTFRAVRDATDPNARAPPDRGRVAAGGRVGPRAGGTGNDAPAAEATARTARRVRG